MTSVSASSSFAITRASFTSVSVIPRTMLNRDVQWTHVDGKLICHLHASGHHLTVDIHRDGSSIFSRTFPTKLSPQVINNPIVAHDATKMMFKYDRPWPQQSSTSGEGQERFQIRFVQPQELIRIMSVIRPMVDVSSSSRTDKSASAKRKLGESQISIVHPIPQYPQESPSEEELLPMTQVERIESQVHSSEGPRKKQTRPYATPSRSPTPLQELHTAPLSPSSPTKSPSDRTVRQFEANAPWAPLPSRSPGHEQIVRIGADVTPDSATYRGHLRRLPAASSSEGAVFEAGSMGMMPIRPEPARSDAPELPLISFDSPPLFGLNDSIRSPTPSIHDHGGSKIDLIDLRSSDLDAADIGTAELNLGGLFPPLRPPSLRPTVEPINSDTLQSSVNDIPYRSPQANNQSGPSNYDIDVPRSPDMPLPAFLPITPASQVPLTLMPAGKGVYDLDSTALEIQMDSILQERGFVCLVEQVASILSRRTVHREAQTFVTTMPQDASTYKPTQHVLPQEANYRQACGCCNHPEMTYPAPQATPYWMQRFAYQDEPTDDNVSTQDHRHRVDDDFEAQMNSRESN